MAKREGAGETGIIATSAMREADNSRELIDALGQTVAILSGDDEARLAYAGVTTDPRLAKRDLLVIDVGGGSTEFTQEAQAVSSSTPAFRLVRAFAGSQSGRGPSNGGSTGARAKSLTQNCGRLFCNWGEGSDCELVGTGGVATIFAMMELSMETVRPGANRGGEPVPKTGQRIEQLWSLPLDNAAK